jgi:uncharacterized membrane protein YbhN (UPF0104 family)
MRSTLIRLLKFVVVAVILAFVVRAIARDVSQIDWSAVDPDWAFLTLGIAAILLVGPLQLVVWKSLLAAYVGPMGWRELVVQAWIPPMGKYVPGKVASIAGSVYIASQLGIPPARALSVAVAMDGLALLTGLIVGLPVFLFEPLRESIPVAAWLCVLAVTAAAVSLHPAVFARIMNVALRKFKRPPLDRIPTVRQYLVPVSCMFAQWVLCGLGVWASARSLGDIPVASFGWTIVIMSFACSMGVLVLLAPGGIGVREGVLLAGLRHLVDPSPAAAVVVVLQRLIFVVAEVSQFAFASMIWRRLKRKRATDSVVESHSH